MSDTDNIGDYKRLGKAKESLKWEKGLDLGSEWVGGF